jgi:hypothetical protein
LRFVDGLWIRKEHGRFAIQSLLAAMLFVDVQRVEV